MAIADGTSPRTRGKRYPRGVKRLEARNIPAHAGKTGGGHRLGGAAEEHPRARGENNQEAAGLPLEEGTSPRTRGKPSTKLKAQNA